jgi:small subunit ribosomal protein S6
MIRRYDTTFIIDGTLSVDDREAVISTFTGSLEKHGGEIEQVIRWGTRTLTHEINKRNRGFYVILYYTADPSIIKTFEREMRINENILRYMTLIFDGTNPTYLTDERVKSESTYSSSKAAANASKTEEVTEVADAVSDDTEADTDIESSVDAADEDATETETADEPEAAVKEAVTEETAEETEEAAADDDSDKEDK